MKKLFLIFLLSGFLFAEDYSSMSTQELIAIMGYVKNADEVKFLRELEKRVGYMKPKERKEYMKNLKKYYPRKR